MTFVPHLGFPRSPLENQVGNECLPKTAVPRSPLLCAPLRAQRWGMGNAMGGVPQVVPQGNGERAGERGTGPPWPLVRILAYGNSGMGELTFPRLSGLSLHREP